MSIPAIDDKTLKRSCWFFIFFVWSLFLGLPLTELFTAWFGHLFIVVASLVGVVWQVRMLGRCRRSAGQWLLTGVYIFLAVIVGQDLWRGNWRSDPAASDLSRRGVAASLAGPAISLYIIFVAFSVLMLCYYRLDRRSDPNESPKSKFGRRAFYAFTATQLISVILIAYTLAVAIYVFDMPLDWERMHRFWKKARLVSPAVLSFLLCFLGAPLALLALVSRFRIRYAIACALILSGNFFLQIRFVFHLVD